MKNNLEILKKVADLVGFKFSSSYNFAEAEVEGGVMITNSTEGEFVVGDTISIKNEDGTFTIVGPGEHKLTDGKLFITDTEGVLVEIKDMASEEPESEVEVVEAGDGEEMSQSTKIEELKQAIHDVLFAFEAHTKEIETLRADLESFKKTAAHQPLKEDKFVSKNFADERYEIIRAMKQNKK
jgi:hypothetical protein